MKYIISAAQDTQRTEADVERGKNYEKNRKKRERKKSLKKGNKIPTEDEVELDN